MVGEVGSTPGETQKGRSMPSDPVAVANRRALAGRSLRGPPPRPACTRTGIRHDHKVVEHTLDMKRPLRQLLALTDAVRPAAAAPPAPASLEQADR